MTTIADTNDLLDKINKDFLAGKKRKEVINAYKDEYGKRQVISEMAKSPLLRISNAKDIALIMGILTLFSALLSIIGEFNVVVLIVSFVITGFFSIPYFGTWVALKYSKNIKYHHYAIIGVTIYHFIFLIFNLILGAMMGILGAGILPIILTYNFVIALTSWKEYEKLVKQSRG